MRLSLYLFLLLLCCSSNWLNAQGVRGSVKSAEGEALPYTALLITPGNYSGIANEQGRFEMKLPPGDYFIQLHFMGYQGVKQAFRVGNNFTQLDIIMERQVFELAEIKVK